LIQDRFVAPTTAALSALQTTTQMRRLIDQGGVTVGPGAGWRAYMADAIRTYGGSAFSGLADRIQGADFAALAGLSSRQVLDGLGGSLGTGISNADRDYIANTVPNPFQSEESFRRFLGLIEDRALGTVDRSTRGYRRAAPNFNAQSDPFMADVEENLRDLGIDPANIRGPRQSRPSQSAAPPPPPPPPAAPAQTQRPGNAPNARPLPMVNGRADEMQLRDGEIYTGGQLGPGTWRWNSQRRGFSRVMQ
jgi:hypothetical protein